MKKVLSLIAILGACVIAATAMTACGGNDKKEASKADTASTAASDSKTEQQDATEAPADDGTTDFGWVKFKMPEGFEETKESSSYTTITDTQNSKRIMKVFAEYLSAGKTPESVRNEKVEKSSGRSEKGEDLTIGGTTWYVEKFTFNGNDSRKFYSGLDETNYVYITAFEMTEEDEAVKTVLESFAADPSKL